MGLVAAYSFDEGSGTTVSDTSGNGADGTLVGASWTNGKYGKALSFNGTSSYVDLGNPASLQLTGSMTWSAWVYAAADPPDDGQIIAKSDDTNGWQFKSSPDTGPHTFGIAISENGTTHTQRYSNTVRSLNTWYYVAGVYNASARTLDIYVNGALDNGTLRGTVPSSQSTPNTNVTIGTRAGGFYFNGVIDEVRVYNRALSEGEIQVDMNTPVSGSAPPPLPSPAMSSLVCTPLSLSAGASATCTGTLTQVASNGGTAVAVSSDNPALTVPGLVTVPAGAASATFQATAGSVATSTTAVVTASAGGTSKTASITVSPLPQLSGLSCSPTSVNAPGTSSCSVALTLAATSGGVTVTLVSNNANVTVPASVIVAAGQTTKSFTATVGQIVLDATAQLSATYAGRVPHGNAELGGTGCAFVGRLLALGDILGRVDGLHRLSDENGPERWLRCRAGFEQPCGSDCAPVGDGARRGRQCAIPSDCRFGRVKPTGNNYSDRVAGSYDDGNGAAVYTVDCIVVCSYDDLHPRVGYLYSVLDLIRTERGASRDSV